ncbi:MAG TPA: PIN domain-containing protein [Solirubrobacterales bacterium]|nr:PIN domain-containing protein [Solirubrobacterales bacterium]
MDSSVWVAAVMPQHPEHIAARDFLANGPPVGVLDLTLYEVANVVTRRYRQPEQAKRLVQGLIGSSSEAPLRVDAALLEHGVELMLEHNLSAYDAAYVAAARRNGWKLVSLDVRDLVSKGLAVTPDVAVYP